MWAVPHRPDPQHNSRTRHRCHICFLGTELQNHLDKEAAPSMAPTSLGGQRKRPRSERKTRRSREREEVRKRKSRGDCSGLQTDAGCRGKGDAAPQYPQGPLVGGWGRNRLQVPLGSHEVTKSGLGQKPRGAEAGTGLVTGVPWGPCGRGHPKMAACGFQEGALRPPQSCSPLSPSASVPVGETSFPLLRVGN